MVTIDVVSACVFYKQTLLTLKRSPDRKVHAGAWEVVSGRVRTGEDLNTAVSREIAEESGLDALVYGSPLEAYEAPYGERRMRVHMFTAHVTTSHVVLSDEHDAFRWVTLEEFASLCPFERLVESARRAFAHVQQSHGSPGSH